MKQHQKPATRDLRLLADYLAATRNEIAVDEMFLALARQKPESVGYLPRVPHWVNWAERNPRLIRAAWRLLRLLWLSGGAFAYFGLELAKFFRFRAATGRTKPISLADGAILGFSSRVPDVVDHERFPGLPTCWLTCPWVEMRSLPDEAVEVPLVSLLTAKDLWRAFVCSLRATYLLRRKQSNWVLQSYTAFRWFAARSAVDRIGGTLVTTEHYDRWAVLADRSVRASRRKGGALRLVMMQHGSLGGLGGGGSSHGALKPWPTRLSCVDELYAYSLDEEAVFRRTVLRNSRGKPTPSVHYFTPRIALEGELSSERLRLLFVGHPLCETFQTALYAALRERAEVEVFYKPHPKAPMSASMAEVGWTVIDNPGMFPRVDMLVSYPSTLVIEYEGMGTQAVVHPLDAGTDALPAFLEQTMQGLEKTGKAGARPARKAG